jgi:hypothetical protein
MDELSLVRDFGADLDESGEALPAAVRARVMDDVVAAAGVSGRPVRARPRSGWRLALAGAVTAVLLAGGMLLVARAGNPAGPIAGAAKGGAAAQVLHHAAQVASTRTEPVPGAGRFTFVESIDHYTDLVQQPDGTFQQRDRGTRTRQVWRSVDGTQPGLVRFRPASDPAAQPKESPLDAGTRGYLSDLPIDTAAMLTYLYAHGQGGNPRDVQAFRTAVDLLLGTYLTSAQQAAMFDALAKIPGIMLRPSVTDLAGRHGVAIVMAGDAGSRSPDAAGSAPAEAVIFDPDTGAYLGTGNSARLRQAVVDRSGQLPLA